MVSTSGFISVLLERVFLRIGSAETDEQFEAALSKFLAPVLLKLASQADGVRKKVGPIFSQHNAFDLETRTTRIAEICLPIGWSIWRANGKTEFSEPV